MKFALSPHGKNTGFTLIEMLMVLVIVALGSSLVAPQMFHRYQKVQAESEASKLKQFLDSVSMHAFLTQSDTEVVLGQDHAMVRGGSRLKFSMLSLKNSKIVFDGNGFAGDQTVRYSVLGEEKIIEVP